MTATNTSGTVVKTTKTNTTGQYSFKLPDGELIITVLWQAPEEATLFTLSYSLDDGKTREELAGNLE